MAKISIVPWIVKKLKRCIGIVEDTDTASQAIASDKYVIWKGDICKSTSAISEGDTLSSSNLSAVNDGIGNDLSQAVANITDSLLPEKANKLVRFNEILYHNASTTLAYTGVSVTIPKNCDFGISGFGVYNNTPPQEIAISSSSNSGQTYNFIAYGAISTGIASVSAIGYTDNSPITLYLHMKRGGTSGNQDGLKGWYISRD